MIEYLQDIYKNIVAFDLIYTIITLLSLIKCSRKGFVLSLLAAAKWLLAYVITLILFPRVKSYVGDVIENEYILDIILGVGIFVIIIFLILFKNLKLSLIGVIPNFIAAFFILGIIGLLGIPLDMMTITIAAITIGIAVDNSIHYIYRFKEEYNQNKNYEQTIKLCHSTVGVAILNTSITIVFGFSILVLSNFIPTIYFGIFTGIAMLLAMISVLTLLPNLILTIKPFKIEAK